MLDAHMHLDFITNAEEVAHEAAAAKTRLFANSVTPEGWYTAQDRFALLENVIVGFGMHPWWVEGSDDDRGTIESLLVEYAPRFIGEVGLDFSKRHAETRQEQIDLFSIITQWSGRLGERVLSIHAVGAAREALDVLKASGTLETCTCIFHWYSGPSDQLKRAIDAGCFFSVNERMLETRKGREYVKAIPVDRLLLETDAPPLRDERYSFDEIKAELERTLEQIGLAKSLDAASMAELRTALSNTESTLFERR